MKRHPSLIEDTDLFEKFAEAIGWVRRGDRFMSNDKDRESSFQRTEAVLQERDGKTGWTMPHATYWQLLVDMDPEIEKFSESTWCLLWKFGDRTIGTACSGSLEVAVLATVVCRRDVAAMTVFGGLKLPDSAIVSLEDPGPVVH